jgi:hypothetical protein
VGSSVNNSIPTLSSGGSTPAVTVLATTGGKFTVVTTFLPPAAIPTILAAPIPTLAVQFGAGSGAVVTGVATFRVQVGPSLASSALAGVAVNPPDNSAFTPALVNPLLTPPIFPPPNASAPPPPATPTSPGLELNAPDNPGFTPALLGTLDAQPIRNGRILPPTAGNVARSAPNTGSGTNVTPWVPRANDLSVPSDDEFRNLNLYRTPPPARSSPSQKDDTRFLSPRDQAFAEPFWDASDLFSDPTDLISEGSAVEELVMPPNGAGAEVSESPLIDLPASGSAEFGSAPASEGSAGDAE